MASLEIKKLDTPDEVRPFAEEKGAAHIVNLSPGPVGRGVFEPGWRWSQHVKPIAKTDSCQTSHLGYVLSGRMHIVMDDGSEGEADQVTPFISRPATMPGRSVIRPACSSTSVRSRTTPSPISVSA